MSEALTCPITGATEKTPLASQNGHDWFLFPGSGVARLALRRASDEETAFQDRNAAAYIAGYEIKPAKARRSLRRARNLRKRAKGNRLLDVGSNVGLFCDAARKIGFEAEGLEIAPALCDYARQKYPAICFHNTPLERFEAPQAYDAIYCSEVIEHTNDPRDFAARLFALLAPGGVLYLTTPDLEEYLEGGRPFRDLGAPDHKIYFRRGNIGAFLEQVGFHDIRVEANFRLRWKRRGFGWRGGLKLTCARPEQ